MRQRDAAVRCGSGMRQCGAGRERLDAVTSGLEDCSDESSRRCRRDHDDDKRDPQREQESSYG